MSFRENNNAGSKRAYKRTRKCYQCFSWCKLNLIHGIYPKAEISIKCHQYSRLPAFTASEKAQKQKLRSNKMKDNIRFKAV